MFQTQTSSLIAKITDKVLRPLSKKTPTEWEDGNIIEQGIVFKLDLRAHDYEESEDDFHEFSAYANMWLILCGNTSVFIYSDWDDENPPRFLEEISLDGFDNTSNHDSCWRSDGLESPISNLYFAMCEEINRQREVEGFKSKAPVQIDTSASFAFSALSPWRIATITHTAVDPSDSYRRRLVDITLLKEDI